MILFELASQSRQNVEDIVVELCRGERTERLVLHHILREHKKTENLSPADALVNGGMNPAEFTAVLIRWMDTQKTRRSARRRFIENFRLGHHYKIDRLVGAANAFDLLPSNDFNKKGLVPKEVTGLLADFKNQVKGAAEKSAAINQCKDRLLNSIYLAGGLNLREKSYNVGLLYLTASLPSYRPCRTLSHTVCGLEITMSTAAKHKCPPTQLKSIQAFSQIPWNLYLEFPSFVTVVGIPDVGRWGAIAGVVISGTLKGSNNRCSA